ncbi:MAG TPA: hypothetical protein VN048_08550 [Verrucomicrobiae bacterium]|jgi:hypothetical protein|nr:hypothetical protein [Verrucomicrobiae bacterium]
MIPSSSLYGAESALPVTTASPSPSDFSAATAYEGEDFSSFISQALNSALPKTAEPCQDPPPPTEDADAADASLSDNYDSSPIQSSDANASTAPTEADSPDAHSPKSTDRKRGADTIDSATANNLAALLAGAFVPTTKMDHSAPMSVSSKPGTVADATGSVTVLDGKATTSAVAGHESSSGAAAQTAGAIDKSLAAGAPNPATGLKPIDGTSKAAKDSPQTTPASLVSPPNAATSTKATSQAAILQTVANIGKDGNPVVTDAGTSAALDTEIMKFTGQQNETAGRAVQKLPRTSSSGSLSSDSSDSSVGQLATTGSGRKTEWTNLPGMADLTVQSATGELREAPTLVAGSAADSSASQVERVAHLVTQEAMTLRQSGAASLAVSLKLDHQTELFVQLTNHNGQIQASLRCERGNLAGLDGHWGQLQESLARQNVQLLPQEGQSSFRDQAGTFSDAGSKDAGQSSQNQRQPSGNLRGETTLPDQPVNSTVSPKSKTKNSGRKGWESWA